MLQNLSKKKKKTGRPIPAEQKVKEDLQEKARALLQSEELGNELLDSLDAEARQKRRRQDAEQVPEIKKEEGAADTSAQIRKVHMTYHYPATTPELRSRKHVNGPGVQ